MSLKFRGRTIFESPKVKIIVSDFESKVLIFIVIVNNFFIKILMDIFLKYVVVTKMSLKFRGSATAIPKNAIFCYFCSPFQKNLSAVKILFIFCWEFLDAFKMPSFVKIGTMETVYQWFKFEIREKLNFLLFPLSCP